MSNKGTTLVELVMVIVILAALAVVAIPRMVNMPGLRVNMAARKIQSDIRYTQSLAISTQMRAGINFRAAADSYSVYIEDTAGNWSRVVEPLTKEDFVVNLNSGDFKDVQIELVYFNGYNKALVFDKWGNPYGYELSAGAATPLNNPAGVRLSGWREVRVGRGTGWVDIQ